MCVVEDRAARGLVHPAGFHPHQAVFHDVGNPHAVCAADLVELFDQGHPVDLLPVQRHGDALLKREGQLGGLVGSFFRGNPHLQEIVLAICGLVRGILEIQALVGQMPQVFILGIVVSRVIFRGMLCASA